MADYYTLFSVLFPVGSTDNIAPALALYEQLAEELEEDETIGFLAEADEPPTGGDLWLHSDESGEPEHVITFALRCAEAFGLTGIWGFRWSLSCSKPRLDGYGGGAQLLDLGKRESLEWVDCEHWVADRIEARQVPRVSVSTILDPVVVEQGWTQATQACELEQFIDREIAADPAVADRFRAFLAEVTAPAEPEKLLCRECGKEMWISDEGTSHHWGDNMGDTDYERDQDHVAVADEAG